MLGSHVKRPKQYHLQSVSLRSQALVTRRWVSRDVHTWFSFLHPWSLSSGGGLGGSGFWPFFPAPSLDYLFFLLYQPAFTVLRPRIGSIFPRLDTCPISLYPKSLGVVVKAKEYGSVKCRVLNGSKGSFPQIFQIFFQAQSYTVFAPLSGGTLGLPRAELSSAVPQGHLVLYIIELGPQPSSAWVSGLPTGKWAWPINYLGPTTVFWNRYKDYQIIRDIYCFLGQIYINHLLKNLDCAYPLIIKFCSLIF